MQVFSTYFKLLKQIRDGKIDWSPFLVSQNGPSSLRRVSSGRSAIKTGVAVNLPFTAVEISVDLEREENQREPWIYR